MADDRPQYQHGVGTIGGQSFHWGSGTPGQYWSVPYGDYPVTPDAPTGAWAHQVGAIPIANNVIPDPLLGRNRIGIMIHSGSSDSLDQLYTQGCFKVAPQEWPAVRSEILKEAQNGPLYLHVQPGGVAAFTNTKTFSQAGDETPAANANAAANTTASASAAPGKTINSSGVIDTLSKNIASIESGGQKNPYEALNPTTHAIGKYQVMPNNVAGWTQAATGQAMTPDEFKASPSAQEAVFRDQMQRSLQLYGPKDAASIWFTGKPYNVAGGAVTDANKTTNASYVARATAGLDDSGGQPARPVTPTPASAYPPGTRINSNPVVAAIASGQLGDAFKSLNKTLGGKPDDGEDGQQQPQPSQVSFPQPQARNVSALLGGPGGIGQGQVSPVYAQRMAALAQPMTWGADPPGQMFGAGFGPQNQPVYGTSLMSQFARQQQMLDDPMWTNQTAGAGYG